jgi:hypothetical protein
MVKIEQLAEAALDGAALRLRAMAQDWLAENPHIDRCERPAVADFRVLAVAASLAELFAERVGQSAPPWTSSVGPLPEPAYLVRAATTMKRLRSLCERESPLPLRKRRLYAPPDYLRFV